VARDLIGRASLVDELADLVDGRQPTVIIGPRRSGKTSLLKVFEQHLRDEGRAVTAVALEGRSMRCAEDLATLLDPTLKGHPDPREGFLERFASEPERVFLIDEVGRLKHLSPLDLGWFRNASQNTGSFVVAGTHWDWQQVFDQSAADKDGSPLNNFHRLTVGEVADRDAIEFVVSRAPEDAPIPEAAARWIVEECGAWPYYLKLCAWELVLRSRAGERRAHNERAELVALLKRLLPEQARDVFRSRWTELPSRVREILVERLEPGKLSLNDRDLLAQTGLYSGEGVRLNDRPFFDWIQRNAHSLPLTEGTS
jgi:hypothetical protein